MSDISLFTSDEDLRAEMRTSQKGRIEKLTDAEKARITIDDDREMRVHRRMRQFAFLLFILPALVALFLTATSLLLSWLVK